MKIEDQDLLLKDLCGRLPYGVKCVAISDGYIGCISSIESQYGVVTFDDGRQEEICDIKPYLFPISSMTKEQKREYHQSTSKDIDMLQDVIVERINGINNTNKHAIAYNGIDWLNAHHFDYRGLIEKGLAIDATGLNIYKEKTK